jgi:multisubunit Na+/H+ antiporter MnhF subunit
VKEILKTGWRPLRLLAGGCVGIAVAALLIAIVGPGGASAGALAFQVLLALVVVAYVTSVIYIRFTEKGREAWSTRRRRG